MMLIVSLFAAAWLGLSGFGVSVAQAQALPPAAPFTPAQRDAIVAIMRDAMKQDPSILRDAVAALEADDRQADIASHAGMISQLAPQLLHQAGDPSLGSPNAKVTVVEFSDVRCPYCRRMIPVLTALLKANKDVRIIFKDLPVLGPSSVLGARAELAAQRQDGYEKMHLALMSGSNQITEEVIKAATIKAGLDWTRLRADMDRPDIQARIEANLALAQQLKLQGTPAYVIGNILLPGAVELADLQGAVDAAKAAN
jgi:protein-disulfide isomerase